SSPNAPAPAKARRLPPSHRRSISSSKGSTPRKRSAAATSGATWPPKRRRDGRPDARNRTSRKRFGFPAAKRSTTTDVKYRYTKYTGDELDEVDMEDLVAKLSDLLLASG